ncbi:hypothetical protein FNV43_RR02564 [Rhamnella rubrinervis]|uniref:Transposase (putative) gypsy type domain-containing protein n=1 Tax=Rhamnella rubrinervis TaxID=2594499 RepID=A0A8K0HTV0_9ROSA|nr:hypothetical protein FNV43_RR02564 [Rhamnella rubrinervis]
MMESPRSDLGVEEQLVRKNSNRGASSSAGTPRPRQTDDPNVETPTRTPSIRIDGPGGNRSGLIIMQPVIIKTDIPSVFKQSDMSYLKEKFDIPSQIKLSAPEPLERADSPRDGWICLYEIAFKIGLRLSFHRIINIVLNFYSIAPGQLMPNSWRYLLGLIVQSEKCGLQIDMATLFEDAPTSDKGWKDRYFFVKREGLCDPVASNLSERLRITAEQKNVIRALFRTKTKSLLSILSEDSFRLARYWPALEETTLEQQAEQNFEEEDPSTQQSGEIPEGIPLPILEVPYLHVLEGCIRLLYGVATDPLWASYPAADMGKLKMKISKAELEAIKKKNKDKQAVAKGGASSAMDKGEERPTLTVVVEPSSLPIAIPSGDSPPSKRPRRSNPPAPAQDKGKKKQTPLMLGLEDSSTIRSDSSLVGPIVDSLMTRHDRSVLREMTLDEIGLEGEQNALKLAQNARYLYDAVIKVDKAFKKKAEAYINAVAANKNARRKQPCAQTNCNGSYETSRTAGEEVTGSLPDPSDEEEDGQEDMEITSGEDEPDDGDALPVTETPRLDAEPNQATSNDSFEEAMRLPSNEESGLGQTSHAVDTDVGAQN